MKILLFRSRSLLGVKGGLLVATVASSLFAPTIASAQSGATPKPRSHPCEKRAPAGAVCSTISVPENHAKPNGKKIDLEVLVLPATGSAKKSEPFIVLPDLGSRATTDASNYAKLPVRKTHDIVLLDQRGTTPGKPDLSCSYDAVSLANFFTVDPLEVELERERAAVKKCFEGYRSAGIDIDAYNSAEAAKDLPLVVKALGAKKATLYGAGVGARVVLQTMRAHSEIVQSAVLDSAEPFTPDWISPSQRLISGNEAFEKLYKTCASQPGCAASRGDLKAKMASFRDKFNKTPLSVSVTTADGPVTVKMNGNDATAVVALVMLTPETLPLTLTLIDTFAASDTATLSQLFAQLLAPAGTDASAAQTGLFIGQLCTDSAYSEPTKADKDAMTSSWAASTLTLIVSPFCRVVNTKPLALSFREPVTSSIPMLVLVGDLNPIGAPSISKKMVASLKNATLVSFSDQTRYELLPSTCAQKIVASFISAPTAFEKSCASRLGSPKFS
jgi:pimeloyl-ACP methyl ester carboxylesterase